MPRQPRFPVTAEHLAEITRDAAAQFPDGGQALLDYTIASEVIINILGPSWWATRLTGERPDPYFLKDADDEPTRYMHQHRVVVLGRDLLSCQDAEGFAEQLDDMRTRSLIGVFHEVRTAGMLRRSGHSVQFVTPTMVQGADFDLLVDGELAVEVKAREDDASYRARSLKSTLNGARTQLPKEGPGLIALRVPDAWAADPQFIAEAEGVLASVLRGSRRVNAVLVLWDEWVPALPSGRACLTRFRIQQNHAPRAGFPNIGNIIRAITAPTG